MFKNNTLKYTCTHVHHLFNLTSHFWKLRIKNIQNFLNTKSIKYARELALQTLKNLCKTGNINTPKVGNLFLSCLSHMHAF